MSGNPQAGGGLQLGQAFPAKLEGNRVNVSEAIFSRMENLLTQHGVRFDVLRHQPVFTSEEAAAVRGVPLCTGAKALFGEGRRRSKVVPRFMSERSGLSLLFAVLVDASAGWHGVKITPASAQQLEALRPQPSAKAASRLAA